MRFTSNRPERAEPGAVLYAGDRELVIATSRPHQGRVLVRFEGVDDRTAAEALHGLELTAAPLDRRRCRAPRRRGLGARGRRGRGRDRAGATVGTVAAVEANPAHDLLVLDGGALVPMVFVVEHARRRRGRRPARRPVRSLMRIDVFTIFPEWFAGPFDASLLGRARAAGLLDLRVHDLREHTTDRHRGRRHPLRRGRGHGHGPGAALRRGRGRRTAPPAAAAVGGRPALRPGGRRRARGRRRLLAAVRPLRGRRPAGRRPPVRRRAVGRRLRARRWARWRRSWSSRRSPGWCRG